MLRAKSLFDVCAFLLFASVFTFLKVAYSQEATVHIDTDLITVPVTVLDRDGRYISNLEKEDFAVFENGAEQHVAFFETTEQPVTVLFLLDLSKSMKPNGAELEHAANAFLNRLRPDDQVLVAYFCDYTKVLRKKDSVENIKTNRVKLKFCGKYTRLYDAVEYAFKKLEKIGGRKAIVLFSDGIDSGISTSTSGLFFVTAKSSLEAAEELDALIFSVQFGTLPPEPPKTANRADYAEAVKEVNSYMRNLAEITGGRYFQVRDISNLEETFEQVAKELGQQYSVGYYPKDAGKKGERRAIKVKVNIPGAAVRTRDSYIVGANKK